MPNLVNPTTGATQAVDEENADQLRRAGWTDETPSAGASRVIGEREAERYTSTGHQIGTAVKGGLSGVSLGLTDLVFDDEDSQKEAEYNPSLRTGSELVGALLPALVGDEAGVLSAIGEATPVGRAAALGERIRTSLGGIKGAIAGGAVEGGIFGAAGALSHAALTDDPLTVESVMGGVGLGSFLGAGAGLLGGGLIKAGEHAEEAIAAEKAEAALSERSPELQNLAATSRDTAREAIQQLRSTAQTLKSARSAAMKEEAAAAAYNPQKIVAGIDKAATEITTRAGVMGTDEAASVSGTMRRMRKAFEAAAAPGAGEKDMAEVQRALSNYHKIVSEMGKDYSVVVPDLPPLVGKTLRDEAVVAGKKYADSMAEMAHFPSSLRLAPGSPQALAGMADARAESYFRGVQSVIDTKNPQLQALSLQMKEGVEQVLSKNGIKVAEGAPVTDGLRQLRVSLRKSAALAASAKPAGISQMLATHGMRKAGLAAGALLGRSHPITAAILIADSLGYKSAVNKVTRDVMAAIGRPAGRGAIKLGPPMARVATSIFGAPDKHTDIRALVANRATEVTRLAAGAHRDMLYSAVGPIAAHSVPFAAGLVNKGASAVEYLASVAPKDPTGGGAFENGRWNRGWLPSRAEAVKYAAIHEAVMAPMDALQRMVSGNFEPAAADALWAVYPTIMERAQAEMVYALSSPDAPMNISLGQRSALGTALRMPLDGLCRPEAVMSIQAGYMAPSAQQVGQGSSGSDSSPRPVGRPAATDSHDETMVTQLSGMRS